MYNYKDFFYITNEKSVISYYNESMKSPISLLCPEGIDPEYIEMSQDTVHDLSLDDLCRLVTGEKCEQDMALYILSHLSKNENVIRYRTEVFEDILLNPGLRKRMLELLKKVDYIRQFSSFNRESDAAGIWQLLHRLGDLGDYIVCVEELADCLSATEIKSLGLISIRDYVKKIHQDGNFAAMKKDIAELKFDAAEIKSLTIGINLNNKMEPVEIGINSINRRPFKNSKIFHNMIDACKYKNEEDGADWDGSYKFSSDTDWADSFLNQETFFKFNGLISPVNGTTDVVRSLDRIASGVLRDTCRRLKNKLSEYAAVSINVIINNLLPELLFYVKFAEYIEGLKSKGFVMNKPSVLSSELRSLKSEGLYNLKLTEKITPEEIVGNTLDFDPEHRSYILTGANRGGKTTITVAAGIAFVMAQAGLYVPADSFEFSPVDQIHTHFPADENKTMELGRLGEESRRFKESYRAATKYSLLLLNESFSTTSFEEGYYIARGAVKAILSKGCRTIYNTHMHKLAFDIDEINGEVKGDSKASSMIVVSEGGVRSFKVKVAKPVGQSYAMDIAIKYGVTYEQLMEDQKD